MAELERGAPGSGPRLCNVSLLFSDLCGFTALTETSDPEDVDVLRREFVATAEKVVEKSGGIVNQVYGDGILAIFGLPGATEEDGRHAIEAALELHAEVRRLPARGLGAGFEPRVHSGIESGLVLARSGDPRSGQYQLTGDAVNTAARLCASASRDELLVSETTLQGLEALFELELLAPLAVEGKRKRVTAYRVLGRSNLKTRFEARARRGLTPLIGRAAELERLQGAMAEALQGRRAIVGVLGAPGLGKTRLLVEFMRWVASSDANTYRATCESHAHVAPFQPFLELLRQLLEIHPELAPEAAREAAGRALAALGQQEHLATFLHLLSLELRSASPGPSSDDAQRAILAAFSDLFRAVARRRPLLLVIDDWQWADDASRQVLAEVLRALDDLGAMVLIGARTLDRHDGLWETAAVIQLAPFTNEESRAAIRLLVPRAMDLTLSATLHERSGGNPLFLEELCQTLPGGTLADESLTPGRIPNTIHGIIQARLERLPTVEADLLRAASVVGNLLPLWLLERLSGLNDELGPVLGHLIDSDHIYQTDQPGTFRFKHDITRDGIYRQVRREERRAVHGRIALALEERFLGAARAEHYEALAHHWAGSGIPARAVEYAELAGDKAAATSSLDRARLQYRAALEALEKLLEGGGNTVALARSVDVSMKWAAACVFSPHRDQIEVLERAYRYAERLGDKNARAHAAYWLGWIYYALGAQDRAIGHTDEARRLAEEAGNSRLTVQLAANLGQSLAAAGEYTRAIAVLEQAIAQKRSAAERGKHRHDPAAGLRGGPVPVGYVYALACKGLAHTGRGEFNAAEDCYREALATIAGYGHAVEGSLLVSQALMLMAQTRWDDCIDSAARARATAERVNGPYVFALSELVSGYAEFMRSRHPGAIEQMRSAIDWLEVRGIELYISWGYANLAEIALLSGRNDEARAFAERALRRATQHDPVGEASALRTLARLALAERGAGENAPEVWLARAVAAADRCDSARERAWNMVLEGELARSGGDLGRARGQLTGALAWFRDLGMQGALSEVERSLHAV